MVCEQKKEMRRRVAGERGKGAADHKDPQLHKNEPYIHRKSKQSGNTSCDHNTITLYKHLSYEFKSRRALNN